MPQWTHTGTIIFAAFSASLVEFVEALTIILAVGVSRGWRSSLLGGGIGLIVLTFLVLICGPLLTQKLFPMAFLQVAIGILLLLFGLRWLRKAALRAAGLIPMHDEAHIYEKQIQQLTSTEKSYGTFDLIAFIASFKAVLIEGIEVVFIIVAVGAAETSFVPASLGALAALVLVVLLGLALRQPLTHIPENNLKFGVAIILTAFGAFWIGEGCGLYWPGGDLAILALIASVSGAALLAVVLLKNRKSTRTY